MFLGSPAFCASCCRANVSKTRMDEHEKGRSDPETLELRKFRGRLKPDYIAATKAGSAEDALPSRSWVIRAAIPVYIEAARKALY